GDPASRAADPRWAVWGRLWHAVFARDAPFDGAAEQTREPFVALDCARALRSQADRRGDVLQGFSARNPRRHGASVPAVRVLPRGDGEGDPDGRAHPRGADQLRAAVEGGGKENPLDRRAGGFLDAAEVPVLATALVRSV